jgi:hypothetical protein
MSPDNSQNIFILLLVAVITGFALPALLKGFEIIFTRRVTKNTEIRNKQLEIIEQLTKAVWDWRFLGKQVCYYGCDYKKSAFDGERFRQAITDYNSRVWTIFTDIKVIKSKSIVWFPAMVPLEIEALYEYIKSDIDIPLTALMNESSDKKADLSDKFYDMQALFTEAVSPEIEKHIKAIADTISKD